MKSLNKKERLEALKYFKDEKIRLEALINHLQGSGGLNFDCAPPHIFLEKDIPENLRQKTATDFLREYESLLEQMNAALQELEE